MIGDQTTEEIIGEVDWDNMIESEDEVVAEEEVDVAPAV